MTWLIGVAILIGGGYALSRLYVRNALASFREARGPSDPMTLTLCQQILNQRDEITRLHKAHGKACVRARRAEAVLKGNTKVKP